MSRLLVTGGGGFIGSTLVSAALDAGWDVRVLDSFRRDVHRGEPTVPAGVELIESEITDPDALDRALDGVDAVSHQAAKVGLGVDLADTPDYARTNVLGTAELIAALVRNDVTALVLASSMVVYGEGAYAGSAGRVRPAPRDETDLAAGMFEPRDPQTGEPLHPETVDEDVALDPRSIYAVSKLSQEQLCTVWARTAGGRVAALRYHNVYGPGMPRDTPYAGVASIFRSALEHGDAPRVFEDGGQRRDFVHSRDVAAANLAALDWVRQQPGGTSEALNVGSGEITTVLQMAQALATEMGGPAPVVTGEFRAGDVRHITASSEKAAAVLGWRAQIAFGDGIREFATAPLRA